MANWRPVLHPTTGNPLLNGAGNPVLYDADAYPSGPPPECCCPPPPPCCDWTEETAPEKLVVTLSNQTDGCAVGMPGSVEITFKGIDSFGNFVWDNDGDRHSVPGPGIGGECYFTLMCVPGIGFQFGAVASCDDGGTLVSFSCSPFQLVFDVTGNGDCDGTYRVTITL